MIIRRFFVSVICSLGLLVIAGCGGSGGNGPVGPPSNSPIVGSWVLASATLNGQPDQYNEMFGLQGETVTFRTNGTVSLGNPGITSDPPSFYEYTWSLSGQNLTLHDPSTNDTTVILAVLNGTTLTTTETSNGVFVRVQNRIPDPPDVNIVGGWVSYKQTYHGQDSYGGDQVLWYFFADKQGFQSLLPYTRTGKVLVSWTIENGQLKTVVEGYAPATDVYRIEGGDLVFTIGGSGADVVEEHYRHHQF